MKEVLKICKKRRYLCCRRNN